MRIHIANARTVANSWPDALRGSWLFVPTRLIAATKLA